MKLSGPGEDAQSAPRDALLNIRAPGAPLRTQQGVGKHPPSRLRSLRVARVCACVNLCRLSTPDAPEANAVLETKQARKAAFKVKVLLAAHLWAYYFLMRDALV